MNPRLWTPEIVRPPMPVVDGALRRLRRQERDRWRSICDPKVDTQLELAIAFDNASVDSISDDSLTMSHTVNDNTNGLLLASIYESAFAPQSVLYNNIAMTLLVNYLHQYVYYLYAPSIGNNLLLVDNGNGNAGFIQCEVASYTGVSQTGFPDAGPTTNTVSAASGGIATAITPVAVDAWVYYTGLNNSGSNNNSYTNCTERLDLNGVFTADSNGPINGNTTFTVDDGFTDTWWAIILSFAPAATGKRFVLIPS